jgi:hypothetical protein
MIRIQRQNFIRAATMHCVWIRMVSTTLLAATLLSNLTSPTRSQPAPSDKYILKDHALLLSELEFFDHSWWGGCLAAPLSMNLILGAGNCTLDPLEYEMMVSGHAPPVVFGPPIRHHRFRWGNNTYALQHKPLDFHLEWSVWRVQGATLPSGGFTQFAYTDLAQDDKLFIESGRWHLTRGCVILSVEKDLYTYSCPIDTISGPAFLFPRKLAC